MQNEILWQLITAPLGALGFAMIFHLRRGLWAYAALGGFLCWGIYLLSGRFIAGIFLPSLLASLFCGLYGEVLARLLKVPATILFIPSMVPLMPGGSLFYAVSAAVSEDWQEALFYGYRTMEYMLAIALGIGLVWAFFFMVRKLRNQE